MSKKEEENKPTEAPKDVTVPVSMPPLSGGSW